MHLPLACAVLLSACTRFHDLDNGNIAGDKVAQCVREEHVFRRHFGKTYLAALPRVRCMPEDIHLPEPSVHDTFVREIGPSYPAGYLSASVSRKKHYIDSPGNWYFTGTRIVDGADPDYPVFQDPFDPERKWRMVKFISSWWKYYLPTFYHVAVQFADPSLYDPERKMSGARGFDIGNAAEKHAVSGQCQFLRTELNSRPKNVKWHAIDGDLRYLEAYPVCMTDRTDKELIEHMLKFPGPYSIPRNNCHDHAQYMLEFACGKEYAEVAVSRIRSGVFEMIKRVMPFKADPNYAWAVLHYMPEEDYLEQKKATDL